MLFKVAVLEFNRHEYADPWGTRGLPARDARIQIWLVAPSSSAYNIFKPPRISVRPTIR